MVLSQDAVVNQGDVSKLGYRPVLRKVRSVEDNVVGLPFARRQARIHLRRILAINGTRLPVGVGLAVVGIKDLNLISLHQVDATVAAILVLAVRWIGSRPFNVQLAIAE